MVDRVWQFNGAATDSRRGMAASPGNSSSQRTASVQWLVIALVIGGVATTLGLRNFLRGPSIEDARTAFDRGEFMVAQGIAEQVLEHDPASRKALVLAGRAALEQQRFKTALNYFDRLNDDGSVESTTALVVSGQTAIQLGRLRDAEDYFRRVLARDPSHLEANEGLLSLLRVEGRSWEAVPHVFQLCRQRRYVVEHLELAAVLDATWLDPENDLPFLDFCSAQEPDDPVSELGPLRMMMMHQRETGFVVRRLEEIVTAHPDLIDAQAMLGQLRLELADDRRFLAWHSQLPSSADRHPTVWITRARWLRSDGQNRAAIRCLWEALRRYPHDRGANLLLANLLASIGEREQASSFQWRGEELQAFDNLLLRGPRSDGLRTAETITKMIKCLERLGRRWEALGWCHRLLEVDRSSQFAQAAITRLNREVAGATSLATASPDIADLSGFPLPNWPATSSLRTGEQVRASPIAFKDVARDIGLNFEYFVDQPRMEKKVYTFDFAGGGVGVLDFDQDGWPDLYFTQGCRWPKEESEHANQLFRNIDGKSFQQVGGLAGVGDTGFGSGPAIGDINGDGFPDLFVANVGANRLYLNNGDGTFLDASESLGQTNDFSLSAVIADLNRDQLPDLYVVNYLGDDALTKQCRVSGKLRQCSPLEFSGQQDRLYINRGDGRFDDMTETSGIARPAAIGKGMGVIAADIDGSGAIDLFVTNDTTANSLFINKTDSPESGLRMIERGSAAGVAYDDLGRLQGSMGISARDVNADGMLDLFVTNFNVEPNNLFVQSTNTPEPLFNDRALEAKLARPAINAVGWGAQFLDSELDGDWDLIVANGKLEDPLRGSDSGAQQAHFFENQGVGRFRKLPASELGAYFEASRFGRAVVRLDWNRDGLDDLCVTHMRAPVSLLENTSLRRGKYLAMELHGTASNRDAIGAIVTVKAGSRTWTVQQIAGDGFEASNQHQILLGLGDRESVDELRVRWPNGDEQVFENLATDREWILVEGQQPRLQVR